HGDETIYMADAGTTPVPPDPVPPNPTPIPPNVPGNVVMFALGPQYKGLPTTLQPGQIACFPMPVVNGALVPSGYVQVIQSPSTPTSDTYDIWFSTTPGDVNDPLTKQQGHNQWGGVGYPGITHASYTGGVVKWSTSAGSIDVCLLAPGFTYYVNYRHTGAQNACNSQGCTNIVQWN